MNETATKIDNAWNLAAAPESTGHVQLEKSYGMFIGGKFIESSGKTFNTINPATE